MHDMRGCLTSAWLSARSIAAAVLVLSGCAQTGAGVMPTSSAVAARRVTGTIPLRYYLAFRNQLPEHLRFALTPAKNVSYKGTTSFNLAPHRVAHGYFVLSAIAPASLLGIDATDVASKQTLHHEISIEGSSLVWTTRLPRDSGIAIFAEIARIGKSTGEIVITYKRLTTTLRERPRNSGSSPLSDYRVTLANHLAHERMAVTVRPAKGATLHGPSSFVLEPAARKMELLTTPAAYTGTVYSIEYDGIADFPRYPIDVVSDLNAFTETMHVHFTPDAYQAISLQTAASRDTCAVDLEVSAAHH